MPTAANSGLPSDLAEDARLYLRPCGLSTGRTAAALRGAGAGRMLAGGPVVFTACEVAIRTPGLIRRRVAPIGEVEGWARGLAAPLGDAVTSRLALLGAPRLAPGGGKLERPLLMGVINATPDSFSDGGEHYDPEAAVAHGKRLAAAGADILDIGGESVRPGAEPVAPTVEAQRVLPVLKGLAGAGLAGVRLSIDTRHAQVMAAALAEGASIINDVTALTGDAHSLATATSSTAAVVLMHMRGAPETMNLTPAYKDAALEVFDELEARVAACFAAGMARERLIIDPGIGFSKKGTHNLAILRNLALYHGLGCPVLLGVSRKGLTGALDRARPPKQRLAGSLAAALHALGQGVQILRVHDVAATRQAIDVWQGLARATD